MKEYSYKPNSKADAIRRRRERIRRMEMLMPTNLEALQKEKVQTKLEINDPNDSHEKEADVVAKKVVSGEHANAVNSASPALQRKHDEEENSALMAKGEDGGLKGTDQLQEKLNASKGGGQSLDDDTKSEMGSKMGADLNDIKIHTDSHAHEMAEGINAKAFTHGQDIYFKNGNYNTTSSEGKELLAHELMHTQQQKEDVQRKIQRKGEKLLNQIKYNNLGKTDAIDFDKAIAFNQKNFPDGEMLDQWTHRFLKLTGKRDFFYRAIASGQAGHDFALFVGVVQEFLNASVKSTLKIDGALGPLTKKAIALWINNAITFNRKNAFYSDRLFECLSSFSDMPDLFTGIKISKNTDTEDFAFLTASAQRSIYPGEYSRQDGKCSSSIQDSVGLNKKPEAEPEKQSSDKYLVKPPPNVQDRFAAGGADNPAGRMQQLLLFKAKEMAYLSTPPSNEIIEHLLKSDLLGFFKEKERQAYFTSLSGRFDKATIDSSLRAATKYQYDADLANIYEVFLAKMAVINSQANTTQGPMQPDLMRKYFVDRLIKQKMGDQLSSINPQKSAAANAPPGLENDPVVVLDGIFQQPPYFNRYVTGVDQSKAMENILTQKYQTDKETQLKKSAATAIQNESPVADIDYNKRHLKSIFYFDQAFRLIKAIQEKKTDAELQVIASQQAPTESMDPDKSNSGNQSLLVDVTGRATRKKTKIDIGKLYANWFKAFNGLLQVPTENETYVIPDEPRNAIKSMIDQITIAKKVIDSEGGLAGYQWDIMQDDIDADRELFDLSKPVKGNKHYWKTYNEPHYGYTPKTDEQCRNVLINAAFYEMQEVVRQIFQEVLLASKNNTAMGFAAQSKQSMNEFSAISWVPKTAKKLRSVFYPNEDLGQNLENVSVRSQPNKVAHPMELLIYYEEPKEKGGDYTFYYCSDPKNTNPITQKSIPAFLKQLDDDKSLTPGRLYYEDPETKRPKEFDFVNGVTLSELLTKISMGVLVVAVAATGVGLAAEAAGAAAIVAAAESVTGAATVLSLGFFGAGVTVDMIDKAQKGTLTFGTVIVDLLQVASSILLVGRAAGKLLVGGGVTNKTIQLLNNRSYAAFAHGTSLAATGGLFISYTADVMSALQEAKKGPNANEAMERIILSALLNFGVMAFSARMDAKSLNETNKGATIKINQTEKGNIYCKIYREDLNPYSSEGKAADRLKSHINKEGNLAPANPNGKTTIREHIAGYEPRKSESPYTSFKMEKGEGKAYGSHVIEVNIEKLRADVKNGLIKDVEIVEHNEVIKALDDGIDQAKAEYDKNPSKVNLKRMQEAIRDKENALRDKEILVKGIIPKEYILVP